MAQLPLLARRIHVGFGLKGQSLVKPDAMTLNRIIIVKFVSAPLPNWAFTTEERGNATKGMEKAAILLHLFYGLGSS